MAGLLTFTAVAEGGNDLRADAVRAQDDMVQDLVNCVQTACDAAVTAMQQDHPYQDRTYNLSGGMHTVPGGRSSRKVDATVEFTAEYAGFVNDGTSRSRAYPFVPIGMDAAELALEAAADDAIEAFIVNLSAWT